MVMMEESLMIYFLTRLLLLKLPVLVERLPDAYF